MTFKILADIVVGTSYGDEGKGKVSLHLAQTRKYDLACRYNGGPNAGHTVYIQDKKLVLHALPTPVAQGVPVYIGPDCVVDIQQLMQEINEVLEFTGNWPRVYVDRRAHVITEESTSKETVMKDSIGTTGKGIGPTYALKAERKGTQIGWLEKKTNAWNFAIVDSIKDILPNGGNLLCEGAQGTWLDIDHGNYPYVTSSKCLSYNACSIGFPPQAIKEVWGVAKAYETRVGNDPIYDELRNYYYHPDFITLQNLGKEIGATTGRVRRCMWLDADRLNRAIILNGITHLVINKVDILAQLEQYCFITKTGLSRHTTIERWLNELVLFLRNQNPELRIFIGDSPTQIKEVI